MLNGGVVIIGGVLLFISKYAKSMPVLIIGRFIVGLNAGNLFMFLLQIASVYIYGII